MLPSTLRPPPRRPTTIRWIPRGRIGRQPIGRPLGFAFGLFGPPIWKPSEASMRSGFPSATMRNSTSPSAANKKCVTPGMTSTPNLPSYQIPKNLLRLLACHNTCRDTCHSSTLARPPRRLPPPLIRRRPLPCRRIQHHHQGCPGLRPPPQRVPPTLFRKTTRSSPVLLPLQSRPASSILPAVSCSSPSTTTIESVCASVCPTSRHPATRGSATL